MSQMFGVPGEPGAASSALCRASTLVALESLMNWTPFNSATYSQRCGRGCSALSTSTSGLQGQPQHVAGGQGGHQVLRVVRAAQTAFRHVQQGPGPAGQPADEQTAIEMDVGAAILRAEGDDLGRHGQIQGAQPGQRLALHNGPVKRLLVLKQPRVGADARGLAGVAAGMGRGEIQQHRHRGTKFLHVASSWKELTSSTRKSRSRVCGATAHTGRERWPQTAILR